MRATLTALLLLAPALPGEEGDAKAVQPHRNILIELYTSQG